MLIINVISRVIDNTINITEIAIREAAAIIIAMYNGTLCITIAKQDKNNNVETIDKFFIIPPSESHVNPLVSMM